MTLLKVDRLFDFLLSHFLILCRPISDGFGAFKSLVRVIKVVLWFELNERCEDLSHLILSFRSKLNDVGLNICDKVFAT